MSLKAVVLVIGDLTRSPRIIAHANGLIKNQWSVSLLGHNASSVKNLPNDVTRHNLPQLPIIITYFPIKLLLFMIKFFFNFIVLMLNLINLRSANLFVVQNPPSVPTFLALIVISCFSKAHFLIDWHNYGYTLVSNGRFSLLARVYMLLELSLAKHFLSDDRRFTHICVSDAMKTDLLKRVSINSTVVYDRPCDTFRPTDTLTAHNLFTKLAKDCPIFADNNGSVRRTRFTELTTLDKSPRWREDHPFLLVSSCSWTPDDDMDTLLQALRSYDANPASRNLICAITGKGPCRGAFEKKIKDIKWNRVEIAFLWLEISDYPKLLGCADLGVCLHKSTSGLDLPMKVVDLFGCGVPVLALNYPALSELVTDKQTGCLFNDEQELAKQILRLAHSSGQKDLNTYRTNVIKLRNQSSWKWDHIWMANVLPLIDTKFA